MDMPVHNIHGFCHASMGNVMAWQNSYYMTFVMLYEFCHAAWVLPYNPLFDPWHAVNKHLRKKVEKEANDTMVILDQAQEDALQKIRNNVGVDSNNVKFCNPPITILADLYKV